MGLISEETIEQILSFYSEESRKLIKHQLKKMEEIIYKNRELYSSDKGYQDAIDNILKQIIEGEFILKQKEDL